MYVCVEYSHCESCAFHMSNLYASPHYMCSLALPASGAYTYMHCSGPLLLHWFRLYYLLIIQSVFCVCVMVHSFAVVWGPCPNCTTHTAVHHVMM